MFSGRTDNNPKFHFHTVGGNYIALCFLGSAQIEITKTFAQTLYQARERLENGRTVVFFISIDGRDKSDNLLPLKHPFYTFWDQDRSISHKYGVMPQESDADNDNPRYDPTVFLIDPQLRIMKTIAIRKGQEEAEAVIAHLTNLPPALPTGLSRANAPVLLAPRIFEPELCQALIAMYRREGGEDSGFMTEVDGMTVEKKDYGHKRRSDANVNDPALRKAVRDRIEQRLAPEVKRVFQYEATRIERYIVACYEAGVGGYFRPHRDNTTKGTAHRRFAVSINLNAEDYEGGNLRFPEFGPQSYRPETGGAVVFSCSLLHEALPVTKGERFVFLPFLYDEVGAKIREENMKFLQRSN